MLFIFNIWILSSYPPKSTSFHIRDKSKKLCQLHIWSDWSDSIKHPSSSPYTAVYNNEQALPILEEPLPCKCTGFTLSSTHQPLPFCSTPPSQMPPPQIAAHRIPLDYSEQGGATLLAAGADQERTSSKVLSPPSS